MPKPFRQVLYRFPKLQRTTSRRTSIILKRLLKWRKVSLARLRSLWREIEAESSLTLDYGVLTLGSCAIATFGLLANSAAVIIGAMIIAPLMLPIRGIALGALWGKVELFWKGVASVAIGTVFAVGLSWLIGSAVGLAEYGSEVWGRSQPTLLDLGVAVVAGSISGFAKVQPRISSALAGTAIAVALMPPICVVGLGLSQGDLALSQGAGLLYLTNLLGITLACMLTFLLAGYSRLARAHRGLLLTLTLTGFLFAPLGVSFIELVRQSHLEASLKQALLDRTITFQRVQLIAIETNWLVSPPEVRLVVRAQEPITPKQVRLLEAFVAREMERPFVLIFEISQVQEVSREDEIEETP